MRTEFSSNFGEDATFTYPTSHAEARAWLNDFLEHRFADFGQYEDAISARETVLFHALLTPVLNIGLLSPREVVDAAHMLDVDPVGMVRGKNADQGFVLGTFASMSTPTVHSGAVNSKVSSITNAPCSR